MPHLPDSHHDHDLALVAAFAADDAQGADRERAADLVARCTSCATVRDDLVALRHAMATLPAPRRTRDYRLTAEQAARLRPAGWRRFLGAFGSSGFRFATPVGTAMATLGLAGLILSSTTAALPLGAAGAAPANGADAGPNVSIDTLSHGGLAGSSAEPDASGGAELHSTAVQQASASAGAAPPAVSAAPSLAASVAPAPSAVVRLTAAPIPDAGPIADSTRSPSPLVAASLLLLVSGAMLVVLRTASRRVTPI